MYSEDFKAFLRHLIVTTLSSGHILVTTRRAKFYNNDDKSSTCHTAAFFAWGPWQGPTSPMFKAGSVPKKMEF